MILLVLLLALSGPRLALVCAWLFTNLVGNAFDGPIFAIAGFLLAPWTTLAYVLAVWSDGPGLVRWLVVAVGAFADLTSYGGGWLRLRGAPALAGT